MLYSFKLKRSNPIVILHYMPHRREPYIERKYNPGDTVYTFPFGALANVINRDEFECIVYKYNSGRVMKIEGYI